MTKAVLVLAALVTALAAGPCNAHAKLDRSTPADHATLKTAPPQIVLHFTEKGQLGSFKLLNDTKEITIAQDFTPNDTDTFTFRMPPLPPGNYTAKWSMLSGDDGHVTTGSFSFTIGG